MCYSAQIRSEYKEYVRAWGADIDIDRFVKLYWDCLRNGAIRTPKAMDAAFARSGLGGEPGLATLIEQRDRAESTRLEQEIFKQRKRLADAERTLQAKTTKAATESKRIATAKVAWAMGKLADLRRNELEPRDSRIFPGWHAPVMVMENGRRVVKPMRYQCRPAGKPATHDVKYPGCYSARRDNLEGFWRELFGYSHGLMMVDAFYENVRDENEQNVVLEFRPTPPQPMLVACLWSRWTQGDEELLSFAAITDEPPPEIAAAGHDRVIIPIKPANIDAWLDPSATDLARQYAILDDRERPYYEHRKAA